MVLRLQFLLKVQNSKTKFYILQQLPPIDLGTPEAGQVQVLME